MTSDYYSFAIQNLWSRMKHKITFYVRTKLSLDNVTEKHYDGRMVQLSPPNDIQVKWMNEKSLMILIIQNLNWMQLRDNFWFVFSLIFFLFLLFRVKLSHISEFVYSVQCIHCTYLACLFAISQFKWLRPKYK